jgi:PAS domain S-box-containing protein
MKKPNNTSKTPDLRQKAEQILKNKSFKPVANLSDTDTLKLIHELQVNQIELELTIEELMVARSAATSAAEKYLELYDFAPTGYFTLSKQGKITDINLHGARMLGKDRLHLNGVKFSSFVSNETKPIFNQFLDKVLNGNARETCEVTLSIKGSLPLIVILTGVSTESGGQCFVHINDISERKKTEKLQSLSNKLIGILNGNLTLKEIIERILEAIQQETKFSAVGIRLKKGDDFPYFAQNGFAEDFLLSENTLTVKGRDGGVCRDKEGHPILECTCGMVITGKTDRSGPFLTEAGSFWTNNSYPLLELPLDKDPRLNPRNNCIHVGFGSVALIPIRTNENIVGILQLNEKRKDAFTTEMIGFFEGIGEIIGAALMRKQAEESVAALSLRNQTLLQTASDGIHVLDKKGNVVEANQSFCKMLGYSREELFHLNVADWDTQWSSEALVNQIGKLIRRPAVFTTRHRCKDGTIIDVEINGVGVTIEGQDLLYASARDITERKRASEALKLSEIRFKNLSNQLEAILDHIPSLIFYKDKENNFIRVNKYVAHAYGKEKKELEGVNVSEIYPKEVADKYYQDDLEVINSGTAKLNIEEPWETLEGKRWVSTSKIPFVDNDGSVIGVIGVSMDITRHKMAEEEIRQKNEELHKLIAEKDKFFSIIAHDLRSPFNAFLGFTRIMVEELHTLRLDQIQQIALSMRNSATNLYTLLENLLEWAQMKRGLTICNPESLPLKSRISESTKSVRGLAEKKGVRISIVIPNDLIVFADEKMLAGIIRNISTNAVKFSSKGGNVTIKAKPITNGWIEISIKDTGIGMNQKIVNNLFNLDIDTNRNGTEGEPSTGLGLFICKDFVEKHGGKLWVESEEGKGSAFYFTLPGKNDELLIGNPGQ